MAGFDPAPASGFAPTVRYGDVTSNDPREVLPPAAQKFTALAQRAHDLHSSIPMHETIYEMAKQQTAHQNRINYLVRHRSEGGMGQAEDAPAVVDEQKKLARASSERARLQELSDIRGQRWAICKRLETNVIDFVLKGGIPGGCQLAEHEDEPTLLKKGERIADAVERYRHRLRELAADRHRVKSSPWPSSQAKAAVRAQITALADAAAPDCDRAIEHGLPVNFATVVTTALAHGTDKPTTVSNESVDFLGLLCWLMPDQIVARIEQELDAIADDKAALSQQQRDEMEAQINSDMLLIERAECSLIWHNAEASNGEVVIDFREGTSPLAILGCKLVTAPAVSSSNELYAYDIFGGGGRR